MKITTADNDNYASATVSSAVAPAAVSLLLVSEEESPAVFLPVTEAVVSVV